MIELIDTHIHLYDSQFDSDLTDVVAEAKRSGVAGVILPSIDSTTYLAQSTLCESLGGYAWEAAGVHPTSVADNWRDELNFVLSVVDKRDYVAIGEVGIDCYWSQKHLKEQIFVFEEQLKLASDKNLPVIIHSRDSMEVIIDSLKKLKHLNLRGIFHAYSGSYESYKEIIKLGEFKIGVGGVVTFKNSRLADLTKRIPLNNILLETDAPWLTPAPFRGERNKPSYLKIIAEKIAELKGCSVEEVAQITTYEAKMVFRLN